MVKTATPYVAIAAGTVLTVASLGTASPVGVALIVAGVAQAGAQGYSDIKSRQAAKAIEAINNQSAAEVAAISAGSPAQREAAALPDIEQERLNAASFGAQASEYSYPALNWAWWTGDLDEQSATTYGEQMQAAGL